MRPQTVSASTHARNGRRLAASAIALLVILRSLVFVCWPQAHFDSDQAVTGLMAKHLSELRAFPVFWYGQKYMLGVEAWLAAPLMRLFGPTVFALKLPLLAMNVAIALLLFATFATEVGLSPVRAAFATLFFAAAAPITAAELVTANGGNVEPLLYVLLLWTLRRRPVWMGLVLGIGFLNREFTIYGLLALLALDLLRRRLFSGAVLTRYAAAIATAAAVWLLVLVLRGFSSAAGPGTSIADLYTGLPSNDLVEFFGRLCLDGRAMIAGVGVLFTDHWPDLFGVQPRPLVDFGIESPLSQGIRGGALLIDAILALAAVRLVVLVARTRRWRDAIDFCAYLVLAALFSVAGYIAGRCGQIDFFTMRYELLSLVGAAGLAAWYLATETSKPWLAGWALLCSAVFALACVEQGRLLYEYATHPPIAAKQDLIRALDAHGIRYGYADFWTAYYVDFLTRERIVLAPRDVVKIRLYNAEVDAHPAEAVTISRRACPGGTQLTPAFWACRP
ncbi:MAG: hypothetical protein ACRD1V_20860 [Vicinamibacterales bacterium]